MPDTEVAGKVGSAGRVQGRKAHRITATIPVSQGELQPATITGNRDHWSAPCGFFSMIPHLLTKDYGPRIGHDGIAVYVALAAYADRSGRAFPSIKTLANDSGLKRKAVMKAVKKLEEVHLIRVDRSRRGNIYQFLPFGPSQGPTSPSQGLVIGPSQGLEQDLYEQDLTTTAQATKPMKPKAEVEQVAAVASLPSNSSEGETTLRRDTTALSAMPEPIASEVEALFAEAEAHNLSRELVQRELFDRSEAAPSLCREILAHFNGEMRAGRIQKPTAALRAMIRDPIRWNLRKTDSGWQRPGDGQSNRAKCREIRAAETLRQRAEHAVMYRRPDEAVPRLTDLAMAMEKGILA